MMAKTRAHFITVTNRVMLCVNVKIHIQVHANAQSVVTVIVRDVVMLQGLMTIHNG